MAHLLGSQNCVESLSKDVTAMQECIQTILAKTGHLEQASWKYPSKAASSLDIAELVEDYAYCADDPESNRLSHIVLFELIIDRFCLLLQCVGELFTSVCSVSSGQGDVEPSRPPSRTVTTTMSVALVTKLFVHKMADVERYVGAVDKEVGEYNQSLMKMEDVLLELTVENEKLKRSHTPATSRRASAKVRKKSVEVEEPNCTNPTSTESHNKTAVEEVPTNTTTAFTQTYETAFVPCEACAAMQANIIKVGTSVIDICESHGLPCSLAKQKKLMKNTAMTANDVARWCTEEERDIAKVSKFLQETHDQLGSLESELTQMQSTNKTLNDQLESIAVEREKLRCRVDLAEEECTQKSRKLEELEQKLTSAEEAKTQLGEENLALKDSCTQLSDEVARYKQSTQVLEDGMKNLTTQLETHKSSSVDLQKMEEQLRETCSKLEVTEEKLKETLEECNKLKGDKKVILEHDQGLQVKQTNLLSRIEKLDETCKDLVTQLGENEEEIENITEKNAKQMEEIKQLKEERTCHLTRLKQLEMELKKTPREDQNCEKTILCNKAETNSNKEVEKLCDQLRLIVCYPVIGKDYKDIEENYTTTVDNNRYNNNNNDADADVLKDLENQISANSARIGVLDEQNYKLRNSLLRLEQANLSQDPLSAFETRKDLNKPRYHSATTPTSSKESLEPRPPSEPRTTNKISRPRSANRNNEKKQPTLDIGAKLANLDRLKNSSGVERFDWTSVPSVGDLTSSPQQQGWQEGGVGGKDNEHSVAASGSVICADCDKTYLSTRDLDIHKNFCYGKISK